MSITNYTELQTAVQNWLARTDSDTPNITSRIPEFIDLAESELNDDLRVKEMKQSVTINPSQVNKYVSLPTGFLEVISLNDDFGEPLEELDHEELEELQYASAAARPEYYAISDRIDFERKAASSHDFTMWYWKRLDIANDSTNSVLTNWPGLYLYGSLLQAEPYLQNDERIGTWQSRYDRLLKKANNRATRSNRKLRTEFTGRRFNILRGY